MTKDKVTGNPRFYPERYLKPLRLGSENLGDGLRLPFFRKTSSPNLPFVRGGKRLITSHLNEEPSATHSREQ